MEDAMWMASIFGPVLLIMGVWQFLNFEELKSVLNAVKAAPAFVVFMGFLNLFLGFSILSVYDSFEFDLTLLVTVLAYLMVIRGLCVLFIPKLVFKWASYLIHSKGVRYIGVITFLWGLGLSFLAFCY